MDCVHFDINFTLSRRNINIPLRHHMDAAAASSPLNFFCVGPSSSSFLLPLPLRDLALLFPVFAAPARPGLRYAKVASTTGLSCLALRGEFSLRGTLSIVHDPLCAVSSVSACDTGASSSSSSGRAPDSVRLEIFDVNRSASQFSEGGEELIAAFSDRGFPAPCPSEREGAALAVAEGVWMCSGRFCARFDPLGS